MNRLSGKVSLRSTGSNDRNSNRIVARAGQWLIWCRLPMLSGVLLWLSFPPVGWSVLAWFALVPLATLIRAPWRSRPIYRPALVGGLVFGLLSVHWIRYADDSGWSGWMGWWALASYMALYFPVFLFAARVAVLRFRVPAIVAVPIVWVGLEYLRSWFLSGFPWYFLAHTQHRWITLIQISDLVGAYGVSFVVAIVNGCLLDALAVPLMRPGPAGPRLAPQQVWRLGLIAAVFVAASAYGRISLARATAAGEKSVQVVLIQTNIPQKVKADDSQVEEVRKQYLALLDQVAAQLKKDGSDGMTPLLIWPETSYLFGVHQKFSDRLPMLLLEPGLTDDDLRTVFPDEGIEPKRVRLVADAVRQDLSDQARRAGVATLMGLNTDEISRDGRRLYNSAVLVSAGGHVSPPYRKIHLVPWGEYLPLRTWLPWLHIFTPHASANYGLDAGSEPVRFQWADSTFGVLICFEDTVPWAARAYVDESQVDFLVNISNDGWFGVADEGNGGVSLWRRAQHEVHLAISVFRAVECRRSMVRAVNTGISAIIDSDGRIVRSAGKTGADSGMTSEVLVGEVPLDHRESLYVRWGDWLAILCLVTTAALLIARAVPAFRHVSRTPR